MEFLKKFPKATMLNRKKNDPAKYVFTGDVRNEITDIQLFRYNSEECVEQMSIKPEIIETFAGNKYNYWLNIHGLSDPEIVAIICKQQNVHSLAIQDILDVNQRPLPDFAGQL